MSFEFFITADGSPTLIVGDADQRVEKMHHSQGALSESLYVYLPVIEILAARDWPFKIFSLGLGLGYNEMILAAWWLQQKTEGHHSLELGSLDSFESEPQLREFFENWLFERHPSTLQEPEFFAVYDQITSQLGQRFSLSPHAIRDQLKGWLNSGQFCLKGAFVPQESRESMRTSEGSTYTGFFYDAFSHKMSPELWSESAIQDVLARYAQDQCAFATYAATGNLKRALKSSGFQVDLRPGFAGKRQCTLAIRPCQLL